MLCIEPRYAMRKDALRLRPIVPVAAYASIKASPLPPRRYLLSPLESPIRLIRIKFDPASPLPQRCPLPLSLLSWRVLLRCE